jgi:hypothetical protein
MAELKIPRHIRAKTPEELERLMLQVNQLSGRVHTNFMNIQFSQGFWYAWYLAKADDLLTVTVPRRTRGDDTE